MRSAVELRHCAESVRSRVAQVATECGRLPSEISIVAVAKTHSLEEVKQVVDVGFSEIGESRVQETETKYRDDKPVCRLHLIGHLQSNKVKRAVELFDLIQSVDSEKLAAKINLEAGRAGKRMPVLLEVNTSGERQKFGFAPDLVAVAADKVAMMDNLVLSGLMTVGPLTEDESLTKAAFAQLRNLFDLIGSNHPELADFKMLSMGMTDDFHLAIAEGANMLRIGRALFGSR